jgi:hypothetical protein
MKRGGIAPATLRATAHQPSATRRGFARVPNIPEQRLPSGTARYAGLKKSRHRNNVPPAEAALLRLPVKASDLTVALPKLYVMTIDELLGVFCRGLIVRAHKLDCSEEMPVTADNINSHR